MGNDGNGHELRKSMRREFKTRVVFYVNEDVINAESIDISTTGIRIETKEPIKIFLRLDLEEGKRDLEAKLVWARKNLDNQMTYGFEYVTPSEDNDEF